MRRDSLIPRPNWELLNTLRVISPGVCITVAPAGEEPRSLCSQVEGVGAPAPEWFAAVYDGVFGRHASFTRPLAVRQPDAGMVTIGADPAAAVRQAWRQITIVLGVAASMAVGICSFGGNRDRACAGAGANDRRGAAAARKRRLRLSSACLWNSGVRSCRARRQRPHGSPRADDGRTGRADEKTVRGSGRGASSARARSARRIRPMPYCDAGLRRLDRGRRGRRPR